MDFLSDQAGIYRRYLREGEGWRNHLDNTASFITEIVRNYEIKCLVVLGSGWLLDLPLENVAAQVPEIILADVHFPPQVVKLTGNYKNVKMISVDITGGFVEAVYQEVQKGYKSFRVPEGIRNPGIPAMQETLVVSLNLLNQLDILPADYILRKCRIDPEELLGFRKHIQKEHFRALSSNPYVIVTDYREILMNREGKAVMDKNLVHTDFPQSVMSREWEWNFDTHGLYTSGSDTLMRVKALYSGGLRPR